MDAFDVSLQSYWSSSGGREDANR